MCQSSAQLTTFQLQITARSHNDLVTNAPIIFQNSSTVSFALSSTSGSGFGASAPAPSSIVLPANWTSQLDGAVSPSSNSTITIDTSAVGAISGTAVYSASGTNLNGAALTKSTTLDIKANIVACGKPVAQITPTNTTCQQFVAGTAATLSGFNYNLKNGAINNVAPGVAFYFVSVSAPAASFTVNINQTDNGSTPPFDARQVQVFDASNTYSNFTSSISSGLVTANVNGATAGQTFVILFKIDPHSVVGAPTPSPSTVTYTYSTAVNGVAVPGSTQSINLAP